MTSVLSTCRLAAQADVLGVIIGSIVGHAACTGAAVLGGKHLAEHIDEKIVGVSGLDSNPLHALVAHLDRHQHRAAVTPVWRWHRVGSQLLDRQALGLLRCGKVQQSSSSVSHADFCRAAVALTGGGWRHVPAVWCPLIVDRARVASCRLGTSGECVSVL